MKKRGRKPTHVVMLTRVPNAVGAAINAMATPDYPAYRVLRDIIVAHVTGVTAPSLSAETIQVLQSVAADTCYPSVDALLQDLASAFIRVYRYSHGLLADDEATPAEEIREMFNEMQSIRKYEEGLSVRKAT